LATTSGRKIEIQERNKGEDEIIFYVCPKPEDDSTTILTGLQEKIKEEIGVDGVHIGASENPKGTDVSTTLRTADLALKRAKEKAKATGEFIPVVGVVETSQRVLLDNKYLDPQELEIKKPRLPDYVIAENVISVLTKYTGQALFLSPAGMKNINAEKGMTGGDEVLNQLAEKIHQLMLRKGIVDSQIFKIGTIFVVPQTDFNLTELNDISAFLPKGLVYSKATLPSSK